LGFLYYMLRIADKASYCVVMSTVFFLMFPQLTSLEHFMTPVSGWENSYTAHKFFFERMIKEELRSCFRMVYRLWSYPLIRSYPFPIEMQKKFQKRVVHMGEPTNIKALALFCIEEWAEIPPRCYAGLIKLLEIFRCIRELHQILKENDCILLSINAL